MKTSESLYLEHEWKRTCPDLRIYVPSDIEGLDAANQHFLVVKTPAGTLLGFWTTSTFENADNQRVVCSRSTDRGQTWSPPQEIDGPNPDDPPRTGLASWQFPVVAPGLLPNGGHRVYCFYNKNVGVDDARPDTTGALRARYSDDDGITWSEQTYDYPIAGNAISHPDPNVPANWIVYQNIFVTPSEGHVLAPFTRWASNEYDAAVALSLNLLEHWSEVCFLRFENILTEPQPEKLVVTTWPKTAHGLTIPSPYRPGVSVCQEPTVQALSDDRLICVMRSLQGMIYFALSEDDGYTWDEPRPLRYEPGGNALLNPIVPCPLYQLQDGRYLLLFYNNDGSANGGKSPIDAKCNRYPAWVTVGREIPGERDHPLRFGPPKIVASSDGVLIPYGGTQVAPYPSLVDDGQERILFYPDRKHYLLGKYLTDDWLADCDPATNPVRQRPPTDISEIRAAAKRSQ
jgi:hypothetical protein